MGRLCTECGKKIDDGLDVILMKIGYSGDLCKECWDNEWEKLKSQVRESLRGGYIGKHEAGKMDLEIRKTIEVEVLASNREVINELEKNIYNMNGQIFDKGKIRVVSTRWIRG